MIRSFYTATSGVITQNRNLNVISNNMSNVNTVGFKKDTAIANTFAERMVWEVGKREINEIGAGSFTTYNQEVVTDYSQGSFEETGRNLDFALAGAGFFATTGANGQMQLTRDGQFMLDNEGFLSSIKGGRVLGSDGNEIYLGTSNFTANDNGALYIGNEQVGQIAILSVIDMEQLVKTGEGYLINTGGAANLGLVDNSSVMWRSVEKSNVNMTEEMSKSMVASRTFQSCSQVMKMMDELTQQAVTELGKVR